MKNYLCRTNLLLFTLFLGCTPNRKELQEKISAQVDSIYSVSINLWLKEADSICEFSKKINKQRWVDSILVQRTEEVEKLRKEL